jgi:hypothetical protein
MRFMFRRGSDEELQADLKMVQDSMQSGYFLLIDLIFWALLLTVFTKPVHHSMPLIVIVYFSYYIAGVCIFLILRAILKIRSSQRE